MISDITEHNQSILENSTISKIRIQTSILKAIHDFLEEQLFEQLLPQTLNSLSYELFNPFQHGLNLPNTTKQRGLEEQKSVVINHQLLIGFLDIKRIYSVSTTKQSKAINSQLDLEIQSCSFLDTLVFMEKLIRRIKVDIETKEKTALNNLITDFTKWENKFPVISRHDIELEFGDEWQKEATSEFSYPFFVSCVSPEFYDAHDPERVGDHYLNFDMYLPNHEYPVARGSEREFRYEQILNRMGKLGINRFDYRNFLLNVAEGKLLPSSGASISLDHLVSAFINQKN